MKFPMETGGSGLPAAMNRRNALRLMAASATGVVFDGAWIEPARLSITQQDVICKRLPSGLEGLRIGLLADFHFRPNEDEALLERVVQRVAQEKLDLIALAGDFMNKDPEVLGPLIARLKTMTANHGVFAVMGNHDGWNGNPTKIRRQFEQSGISFLINEHSQLSIRGDTLAVAGTDFVWLGKPDPARALRGISADVPVLALVHEPDYFDVMTRHRDILLQLSGHTHGGQCRIPLVGYSPITVKHGTKYIDGSFSHGDSNLFVTRGVGTTGLRVRFACPPELAILTLRQAALV
ncbi:MAG: metallophosphoesterase [Akkermansiaceae bacterium]|nr:metallophosphoesterase [Akkermansiaceae bacterium]